MKKIFAFVLLLSGLTLASCGSSGPDLSKSRFPEIETSIQENLNIAGFSYSTGSKRLNTEKVDSKDYFDVYIPTDYKDRLFQTEVELKKVDTKNPLINDKTQDIYANTLTFGVDIWANEQQAALNEIYNSKYGIKTLDLGFTINEEKKMSKNAYDKYVLTAYNELDSIKLNIVYLPTLAVRMYNSEPVFKDYFFIPVYFEFTSNGKTIAKGEKNAYTLKDREASVSSIEIVKPLYKDGTQFLAQKVKTESETESK